MMDSLTRYIRRQRLLLILKCLIYYKALVRRQSTGGMREQMVDSIIASVEMLIKSEGMVQHLETTVPDAAHHIRKEKL